MSVQVRNLRIRSSVDGSSCLARSLWIPSFLSYGPATAESLNNSAALYDDSQGRFNIAERLYVECVATRQRTRSTHHLAVLCRNEGDRAKADSLLRLCLEQRSTQYEVFNISITLQGQKILDHFE